MIKMTEIPEKQWYQFADWFTRQDELQELQVKLLSKILETLSGKPVEIEIPPKPTTPLSIAPTAPTVSTEKINQILDYLSSIFNALYPNRFYELTFNTINDKWDEKYLLANGFIILSIGGGFTFKINSSDAQEFTAQLNDKFIGDIRKIFVKGSGTKGTAKIRYWRRV